MCSPAHGLRSPAWAAPVGGPFASVQEVHAGYMLFCTLRVLFVPKLARSGTILVFPGATALARPQPFQATFAEARLLPPVPPRRSRQPRASGHFVPRPFSGHLGGGAGLAAGADGVGRLAGGGAALEVVHRVQHAKPEDGK